MTRILVLSVAGLLAAGAAEAQVARLKFAAPPRLINCEERACFRILLEGADKADNLVSLPSDAASYAVHDKKTGESYPVFHVAPLVAPGERAAAHTLDSLILFDLSGSMNRKDGGRESRFESALRLLKDSVNADFREGTYRWAVTGFHSRNVVGGVEASRFADTKSAVRDQIDGLAVPQARNNTALYSAMAAALPLLKAERERGHEVRLIVLTDGKNDVNPDQGDDRGLLEGDEGLRAVKELAGRLQIEIVTIGFGSKGTSGFDEPTLKGLAWPTDANYHYAGNTEELQQVFRKEGVRLQSRVWLSVGPLSKGKSELTESVQLRVVAGNASSEAGVEVPYSPLATIGAWEGAIEGDEAKAFAQLLARDPARFAAGQDWVLKKVGIFTGFLAFFVAAWFGVPRLMWPERYVPRPDGRLMRPPAGFDGGWPDAHGGRPPVGRDRVPRPQGGRGAPPPRPGDSGARTPPRPDPARGGPSATDWRSRAARPSSGGPAPPPGPRPPSRPGQGQPPRGADDTTVYIPRGKKYEQDT